MAISATSYSPVSYNGDGATDDFAYTFPVLSRSDLKVYLVDSDGNSTLQTYTTHYTATYGYTGGSVAMVTPPASGEVLSITRDSSLTQPTDFRNQGTFYPEQVEKALDRVVLKMQELDWTHDAAAETYTAATLPAASSALVGTIVRVSDSSAPTLFYIGAANADGTYSWILFAQGAY